MGRWLHVIGLFLICGSIATEHSYEPAKHYMEACAKQELFATAPPLNFTCDDKMAGGYYADMATGCHIFHLCAPSNLQSLTDHPFCCHPELVFDQRFLVCDRPENVDCQASDKYYNDQFDGPVKVQQRENEESQAKGRARQSRGSESDAESDSEAEDESGELIDEEEESDDYETSPHFTGEDDPADPSMENAGKAVTLPPAFRQL